ncbi:MAG: ABC transporter permease subunit, partial [Candidatus Thermoplasmatota archaeon]|nr:ABC transporter permease subunit [Candidatus Thermoplasmatota archaeon]
MGSIGEELERLLQVGRPIFLDGIRQFLLARSTLIIAALLLTPCLLSGWYWYDNRGEAETQVIDEDPLHEFMADMFYGLAFHVYLPMVIALVALLGAAELLDSEFQKNTMQLLRTSPVRMYEILLPKLLAGTVGTFLAVGVPLTCLYFALLVHAGSFGLREHLPLLWAALGTLLLASLAYSGIFLLINALVRRPLPVSLVYWLVWEVIMSGASSQRFTIMHYLRSFALPRLDYLGIVANDLDLV